MQLNRDYKSKLAALQQAAEKKPMETRISPAVIVEKRPTQPVKSSKPSEAVVAVKPKPEVVKQPAVKAADPSGVKIKE